MSLSSQEKQNYLKKAIQNAEKLHQELMDMTGTSTPDDALKCLSEVDPTMKRLLIISHSILAVAGDKEGGFYNAELAATSKANFETAKTTLKRKLHR